ncbi:MAG TPA: 2-dehydropantoate 2-reductase, partial [Burkholderiales bacterium]|nr:2-dehydropantoate 2-reductase [Burkholderiales bacterium]
MKFCIYGAGAVGGLIAGWLARSGESVSVVARGAHLDAIRAKGLQLRDRESGRVESFAVQAESDPAALGPQDYVIVAVKGQGLTDVASRIKELIGEKTSVVTAMNGVPWWFFDRLKDGKGPLESLDPGGKIARAIPTGRVVGCVVHLAASTPEPGLVSHNMGRKLIIGEPGGRNSARTAMLGTALAQAGFEVIQSTFIEKDFWVKLLGNVSFNPVSALTGS